MTDTDNDRGLALAVAAYLWWGLSPLFWKQLTAVPAAATLAWRIVATAVLLVIVLGARRRLGGVVAIARDRRTRTATTVSAIVIAANWTVYVWAVNTSHVSEASLGYFVYPLVSVVLGVVVLGERLRGVQWFAVALAGGGVTWLTAEIGRVPWIALTLASSFGVYGLVRKMVPVGSFAGLTYEVGVLVLPALALLGLLDGGANLTWGPRISGLLALSGVFTAVPLVLFAAAAPQVPLSIMGMLQYLNPFLQLALGVWVYDEPFDTRRLFGYVVIWLALALLVVDGLRTAGPTRRLAAAS